jgi:hypothetical protein
MVCGLFLNEFARLRQRASPWITRFHRGMQHMEHYIALARLNIANFDWNSPHAFWICALGAAFLFQRWNIFLAVFVIMLLGENIEKVLVFHYTFNNYTVTPSFFIYLLGAIYISVKTFESMFSR